MKILQISYSLGSGGAERFVVDLSNELTRLGHDVTLCVMRDDTIGSFGFYKNEIAQNINYINLKIPIGFRLKNIVELLRLIVRVKPQIVHTHLNLVNYIFPLLFFFPKIKFFHTIHSEARKEVSNKIEYWISRFFYSNFKMKAITISAETSRSFTSFYKNNPYYEINNGRTPPSPTKAFPEVEKSIEYFKGNGDTIFMHIGSCNAAKNQKMLINVFNKLNQNGRNIVLLIIGSGFESDIGQELRSIACKKIIFLGERHNVFDYLLNADAFCLSSTYEGMPISLIEALACGCTPICTPVGGIINTIEDNVTGYLSQSISESDYYNSILYYLDNIGKIKKEKLIKHYFLRFSIDECAKKYLSVYQDSFDNK